MQLRNFFENDEKLIPADVLKIALTQNFQNIQEWIQILKPFELSSEDKLPASTIRKKQTDFGSVDEIDLGKYFHFDNHTVFSHHRHLYFNEFITKAKNNFRQRNGRFGKYDGRIQIVSAVEKFRDRPKT